MGNSRCCSHAFWETNSLRRTTLLGNPRTLGGRGRARNTDQLFMGESIIQLPREGGGGKAEELEGGCGDHPA